MQFLLFLIGFFSISQLGLHLWPFWTTPLGLPVDYLSPTIYFIDLLLLPLLLLNSKRLLRSIKQSRSTLILLGYIFINIVLSLVPLFTAYSWFRILLLLNLVFTLLKSRKENLKALYLGLLLSTLIVSIISLTQFITQNSLGGPLYLLGERTFNLQTPGIARFDHFGLYFLRPYATFSHPNSLAGFILVSCLLLLSYKKNLPQKLLNLTLVLSLLTLVVTTSRTILLTVPLLMLVYFFKSKIDKKNIGFFLLSFLLIYILTHFFVDQLPKSISERLVLNIHSLKVIYHSPFFGAGLGNYILAQTKILTAPQIQNFILFLQPVHNAYLLFLTETGLIAPLFLATKLYVKVKKTLPSFIFLASTAVLFTSFFDHYWLTLPQNRILLAILLGLILCPSRKMSS